MWSFAKVLFLITFSFSLLQLTPTVQAQNDSDYGVEALEPIEEDESVVEMLSPDEKFDLEVKIEQPIEQIPIVVVSPAPTVPSKPLQRTPAKSHKAGGISNDESNMFSE